MHQWQKFGENLWIDTGDIVETCKSGMHSVMPWPWTLTFRPQNLISSSLSRDAPVRKVWRKSVNRYWRYRGNIKLPRESRTDGRTHGRTHGQRHGRTTRKHIASAGAYRRRRLKNSKNGVLLGCPSYDQATTREKRFCAMEFIPFSRGHNTEVPFVVMLVWDGTVFELLAAEFDGDQFSNMPEAVAYSEHAIQRRSSGGSTVYCRAWSCGAKL